MITSLPNLLTISRVVAIPVLVAMFYLDGDLWRWLACLLFTAAALTDFFDGYLARARQEQSAFGRFLDPIADKLLVAAAILMLVAFDRIAGLVVLPALIILCREILVSGLREFLAELNVGLPVSRLAKWKTTIQMVALGFLIVGESGPSLLPVQFIGEAGLWTAAALTLITGYDYLRAAAHHVGPSAPQPARTRPAPGPVARPAGGDGRP